MAAEPLILALDHGTSGIKAALVTTRGQVRDFAFAPTPVRFLPGGGAEQDPEDWWRALVAASRELMARAAGAEIAAVGVSSTWSTTVAVDAEGRALLPALTWMDSRGAPYVRRALGGWPSLEGYSIWNLLRWVPRTGGGPSLSGKDDVAHALWIKHERPDVYARTAAFLPSKDYLNLRLTGEVAASHDSIMLFWVTDTRDPANVRYDDDLVRRVGLDRDRLPPLRASTDVLGPVRPEVAEALGLPPGVPVVCGSPDHQSALVGSGAVRDFQGHLYIGTSSWVQCPVPFKRTDIFHSIASLPSAIPGRYQAVNEQDIAGGVLSWLVDHVGVRAADGSSPYAALDAMAAAAPAGSGGVLATPWLNGERTPVDDTTLRACLFNLSHGTSREHIVRAVLEGVAFNTRWALGYVERFARRRLDPLRLIGGGGRSDVWCRIFADVLDREIHRVADPLQANARGAALIASVALGHVGWDDVPDLVPVDRTYAPDPAHRATYDRLYDAFLALYRANRRLFRRLNGRASEGPTPDGSGAP